MLKKIYKRFVSEKSRIALRITLQKLVSPFYAGNRFYCNCCGRSFRKFLPKGQIKRLNAKCPHCLSLERTRVLDLFLTKEISIYQQTNIKILHFAPEGAILHKLSALQNVEYIDADINPAFARHVVDITDIHYPDDYFDYIICSHVLGHVPAEAKALSELYRVLKPGRLALIMSVINNNLASTFEDPTIISPADRLKNYGENDLVRLHGADFADRLRAPGFLVEPVDYRLSFSDEEQRKLSLGDGNREVIFLCRKPEN